jgi:hypothetical protein
VFESVDLNYDTKENDNIYFSIRKIEKNTCIILILKGIVVAIKGLHVLDIFISYIASAAMSINYNIEGSR